MKERLYQTIESVAQKVYMKSVYATVCLKLFGEKFGGTISGLMALITMAPVRPVESRRSNGTLGRSCSKFLQRARTSPCYKPYKTAMVQTKGCVKSGWFRGIIKRPLKVFNKRDDFSQSFKLLTVGTHCSSGQPIQPTLMADH